MAEIKIPGRIKIPYGAPNRTSVYFKGEKGEKDYSEHLIAWDFYSELNKLEICKLTLVGLTEEDFADYVKRRNTFKLFAEHHFVGKFRIEEVRRNKDFSISVKGIGMGILLQDAITDQSTYVYRSESSKAIVEDLCREMTINENEDLGKVTGSFSWENKLSALATIANYFQADWWVDQEFPYDEDRFNIRKRRGRIPVVRRYYDTGENRNASISKSINTEFHFNDVTVRGQRDRKLVLLDCFEDKAFPPDTINSCGTWTPSITLKESTKVMIYFKTDQTPQTCYLEAYDGSAWHKIRELNVVANRAISEIVDLSAVKMGDKIGTPRGFVVTWLSHATNYTNLKVWVSRLVPLTTRFAAVSSYYTKLEADLPDPVEEKPFDIACKDTTKFPSSGIIKIGSDPIGYLENKGNVFSGCVADIASGLASGHRAGVLVFPAYNGEGLPQTFLTETMTAYVGEGSWMYFIKVKDTSNFPDEGYIIISDEVMHYSLKDVDGFYIDERACSGTIGGIMPHSKYTRIFQYVPSRRITPDNPGEGSLIKTEGLKSGKFYDKSLEEIQTAEIYASNILEANLEKQVIQEGGLITVTIDADHPWLELQKVGLGDTIYVESSVANISGKFRIKKMHWFFNPKFGHKLIIEAGSKKSLFVEKLMRKWKLLAD